MSEIEVEESEREKEFKKELKDLLKKFGVSIEKHDDYNCNDEVCGTYYYFSGDNIYLDIDEL